VRPNAIVINAVCMIALSNWQRKAKDPLLQYNKELWDPQTQSNQWTDVEVAYLIEGDLCWQVIIETC
jgi:hypothetical protein